MIPNPGAVRLCSASLNLSDESLVASQADSRSNFYIGEQGIFDIFSTFEGNSCTDLDEDPRPGILLHTDRLVCSFLWRIHERLWRWGIEGKWDKVAFAKEKRIKKKRKSIKSGFWLFMKDLFELEFTWLRSRVTRSSSVSGWSRGLLLWSVVCRLRTSRWLCLILLTSVDLVSLQPLHCHLSQWVLSAGMEQTLRTTILVHNQVVGPATNGQKEYQQKAYNQKNVQIYRS